jgi:GNAT superfamily N-acetyltransferase
LLSSAHANPNYAECGTSSLGIGHHAFHEGKPDNTDTFYSVAFRGARRPSRSEANFRQRLQDWLPQLRVVGRPGVAAGFYIVKGDELYQLYVSARSRGSGVAAALIADAEAQRSASRVRTAWVACAIGNERAARFYQKHGWQRVAT